MQRSRSCSPRRSPAAPPAHLRAPKESACRLRCRPYPPLPRPTPSTPSPLNRTVPPLHRGDQPRSVAWTERGLTTVVSSRWAPPKAARISDDLFVAIDTQGRQRAGFILGRRPQHLDRFKGRFAAQHARDCCVALSLHHGRILARGRCPLAWLQRLALERLLPLR